MMAKSNSISSPRYGSFELADSDRTTRRHIDGDHKALSGRKFITLLIEGGPFGSLQSHVERRLEQANAWPIRLIGAKKSQSLNRSRGRSASIETLCVPPDFRFSSCMFLESCFSTRFIEV